jgi:shikimate dehydrogenase
MSRFDFLSGGSRVFAIIGDPIVQVKSPAGVTQALHEKGCNGVVVPLHVVAADFDDFMRSVGVARNVDGIIATIPHKFSAYGHCASATERAHFLGAANILRRDGKGGWHGDMLDGIGFVDGIRAAGCEPRERKALLVGAGGAGSAIALALADAGVVELAIHDGDAQRRDALLARFASRAGLQARAGSADPTGYTIVVNATPAGMRGGDPFPVDIGKLTSQMFVGEVITQPEITPLLEAARRLGCPTQTGVGMFNEVSKLMVEFLLAA